MKRLIAAKRAKSTASKQRARRNISQTLRAARRRDQLLGLLILMGRDERADEVRLERNRFVARAKRADRRQRSRIWVEFPEFVEN